MNNQNLKDWFLHIRRLLPWRENINPYRVWISEIMLQQTRVSTVIPYFIKWMEIFPNIEALAAAPLEKVIKIWEGLGYYSRARSIHKTAGILLERYRGIFPMTIQELEKLPGIGTYTSRAILCFTSKMKTAPVDGNVVRVLSRFYSIPLDVASVEGKKELQALADQIVVDERHPHIVAEGLIELGALICQKIPLCKNCPVRSDCKALQQNRVVDFPVKKPKAPITLLHRTVLLIIYKGFILLRKENNKKIMADLWQLPFVEGILSVQGVIKEIQQEFGLQVISTSPLALERQSFTRYRVSLYPILCTVENLFPVPLYDWVSLENSGELAFCSGHRRILQKMWSNQPD